MPLMNLFKTALEGSKPAWTGDKVQILQIRSVFRCEENLRGGLAFEGK
jgi:hypothetical protein